MKTHERHVRADGEENIIRNVLETEFEPLLAAGEFVRDVAPTQRFRSRLAGVPQHKIDKFRAFVAHLLLMQNLPLTAEQREYLDGITSSALLATPHEASSHGFCDDVDPGQLDHAEHVIPTYVHAKLRANQLATLGNREGVGDPD